MGDEIRYGEVLGWLVFAEIVGTLEPQVLLSRRPGFKWQTATGSAKQIISCPITIKTFGFAHHVRSGPVDLCPHTNVLPRRDRILK